jgi:hypothetical protein
MTVTLPTGMKLRDWADQICLDLDQFGPFSKMIDETKWQDWAVQFLAPLGLGGYNIANPYNFKEWKLWAEYMCGDLS